MDLNSFVQFSTLHIVEKRKFYTLDKKDDEYVYCCSCNTTKKKFIDSLGDFIKHSIPGNFNFFFSQPQLPTCLVMVLQFGFLAQISLSTGHRERSFADCIVPTVSIGDQTPKGFSINMVNCWSSFSTKSRLKIIFFQSCQVVGFS